MCWCSELQLRDEFAEMADRSEALWQGIKISERHPWSDKPTRHDTFLQFFHFFFKQSTWCLEEVSTSLADDADEPCEIGSFLVHGGAPKIAVLAEIAWHPNFNAFNVSSTRSSDLEFDGFAELGELVANFSIHTLGCFSPRFDFLPQNYDLWRLAKSPFSHEVGWAESQGEQH